MNPKQIYLTDSLVFNSIDLSGKSLFEILEILTSAIAGGSTTLPEITVQLGSRTFGSYNTGDVISEGTEIVDFIENALSLAVAPTYTLPVATLTNVTQTVEVGETLSLTLNISFTQNDGGAINGYKLFKNSIEVSTTQNNSESLLVPSGNTTYYGQTSYDQGPIKNNNLGTPDPTGRINAGSVNSATRTVTGAYKKFYGNSASAPSTSANVRALSSSTFNNTFQLQSGTTNLNFSFWVETGLTLLSAIDIDALSIDIKDDFTSSSLSVNDANGVPKTGTLYVKTNGTPFLINHRINITVE